MSRERRFTNPTSFTYKRAMAWQEKGGQTWEVVRNVRKTPFGVVYEEYENHLPTKLRATRLTSLLNSNL